MPKFKSLKEFLDWVAHAKLLVDICVALAGVKVIKAILLTFTHIPTVWVSPIEWISGALLLWGFLQLTKSWGRTRESGQWIETTSTAISASPLEFDLRKFLRETYKSDLQAEFETVAATWIGGVPQQEREACIRQFIASGLIAYMHDQTWWSIYRSQILALQSLNRRILRLEEVRAFYDDAVRQYPRAYAAYTFDQWLKYLSGRVLIIDQPAGTIAITVRGKDYLKHMVHYGYSSDSKSL